ncbi:hypothetical protein CVIRNUC_008771 [Coccomyxa viridis]|uniref:Uncharacterized protein n=1 Tax=Coccomyxa viridis TaxID=1274662 RepID=A0AAV1IFI2_9CHLO|nr:hypothetical protein CVIRNUC_008771 [Coccomyxa viridis]
MVADSGRGLRQLSFSIPSSAVPGLLGLVSPVEPPPSPNATAASGPQPALAAAPGKGEPAGSDSHPIPEGEGYPCSV